MGPRRRARRRGLIVGGAVGAAAGHAAGKHSAEEAQFNEVAAPAQSAMTTQLQELEQLREQGVITEAEFEAKKKQILGI